MPLPAADAPLCPECGASNPRGATFCWLCGRALVPGEEVILAEAVPESPPQFGLSTVMLVVTLICISLGLARMSPGLIVPLVVVVIPALIRTISSTHSSAQAGKSLTLADKFAAFTASVGVMILIVVAAGAAFLGACFVVCTGALAVGADRWLTNEQFIFIVPVIAAVGMAILILVKTWPKRI